MFLNQVSNFEFHLYVKKNREPQSRRSSASFYCIMAFILPTVVGKLYEFFRPCTIYDYANELHTTEVQAIQAQAAKKQTGKT